MNLILEPNTGKMQDMRRHGAIGILNEKNTGIQNRKNHTNQREIIATKMMMNVTTQERNLPGMKGEGKGLIVMMMRMKMICLNIKENIRPKVNSIRK